jgi:tetratricopeptide (TPR) repeat protein
MTVRGWVVLAMVTVAVVGAITAFRSAKTEQDTAILSQGLAEGELFELATLQMVESEQLTREALTDRDAALRRDGEQFINEAADARKAGQSPEKADWLDMRAQEEFAAARAISRVGRPFKRLAANVLGCPSPGYVKPSPSEAAQPAMEQEVARRLGRLGIETTWCDSRCKPGAKDEAGAAAGCVQESGIGANEEPLHPATIWSGLQQRIETRHVRVRTLASAVAVFTLALAFFTLADASIRLRRRWIKWVLFGGGIAVALVTCVFIVRWVDAESWPWLLAAVVGTPLAGFVLWHVFIAAERRGWIHPHPDFGHIHPETIGPEPSAIPAPVLAHESSDRFVTSIIVALAATVVLSALSGWGYSWADTRADEMALHAREYAADVAKYSSFLSRAQERIGQLASNLECRARLAALSQRLDRFHRDEEDKQRVLRDETKCERRWDKDVDDPRVGADADQEFPRKIVSGAGPQLPITALGEAPRVAEFHAWQSLAMRDAAAQRSVALRRTATWFLATLTLFAISLYMLGQALGMGRHRSAYVLAASGGLFALVGVGLYASMALAGFPQAGPQSGKECLAEDPDLPAQPSDRLARAAYDYAIGVMSLRIYGDAEKAVRFLGCAVALRPDFADAKRRLAYAANLAGSTDSGEPYTRVYQPDRLPDIIAKELAAIDEFKQDHLHVSAWFLNSFALHNLLDAVRNKNDAELDASIDAAHEAIDAAASPGHAAEGNSVSASRFNLGLALLARGQIREARISYADGVSALQGGRTQDRRPTSALTDLETLAALRCGRKSPDDEVADCTRKLGVDEMKALLVKGQASGGSPVDHAVTGGSFTLTASVSKLTATLRDFDVSKEDLWLGWYQWDPNWKSWRVLQSLSGPVENKSQPDGALVVRRSYLGKYPSAANCLAPTIYRAELYANGSLVGAKLVELKAVQMARKQFIDLNMQLCSPSGWTLARGAADGLMRSLETPDHKQGAFLFTEYEPRPSHLPNDSEDVELISGARDSLLRQGLISGQEALQRFDPQDPPSTAESAALIYRFWRSPEGEAHIVIARSDALEPDQLRQMLQSADVIEDETGGNPE